MKTKKIRHKLVLKKKTVSNLNNGQMKSAQGGVSVMVTCQTCANPNTCNSICCPIDETSGCGGSGGGFYSCEGTCNSMCMMSMCELTQCC